MQLWKKLQKEHRRNGRSAVHGNADGSVCVFLGALTALTDKLGDLRFGHTITPLLIALVEIFGLFDLILPTGENGRSFDSNGLAIVLCAAGLLIAGVIVYYAFFRKQDTGTNADEPTEEA